MHICTRNIVNVDERRQLVDRNFKVDEVENRNLGAIFSGSARFRHIWMLNNLDARLRTVELHSNRSVDLTAE